MGAIDPHTPIAQGWLRASHRKLDPELSEEYRPYHTHDEKQPITPGEIVELDVEIWPTCIVVPAGYRIGFTVRGKDYEYPGDTTGLRLQKTSIEVLSTRICMDSTPSTSVRLISLPRNLMLFMTES